MKKILLPIITLLLICLTLVSCDLFGEDDKLIPTLKSIEVLYPPTQLNYKEHSRFKKSGLVIVGLYSDNTVSVS